MVPPAAALAACFLARSARAGEAGDLPVNLRIDVPVAAVAIAAWFGSEAVKSALAPAACRWCASNGLDDGVRSALRWDGTDRADTLSNVTAFALAPAAALGLPLASGASEGRTRGFLVDALVIAEATALAADLNQAVKFLAGRERPFVHALSPPEKGATPQPADNNLSFYSGHTSLVFALAASSGSVATLRRYRLAPAIWGAGLVIAAATGYLRIAADKHYFSDVMTGAVMGAAVGAGVPYLFHRGRGSSRAMAVVPLPAGCLVIAQIRI